MFVTSAATNVATIDWNIFAGAVATFIITALITWQGLKKGKRNVETGKSELTPIVGASLIETASIQMLSIQLQENSMAVRENTSELKRHNDIELLTRKR
jgi:NADH:ubiquinone oxidoreductase subunit 6 (subunit J)